VPREPPRLKGWAVGSSITNVPDALIVTGPKVLLSSFGHSLTVLSVSAWAYSWCVPPLKVNDALYVLLVPAFKSSPWMPQIMSPTANVAGKRLS